MSFQLNRIVPWGRTFDEYVAMFESLDFHLSSIKELCRVAKEVRMFPLLNLAGETSQHLDPVLGYFMSRNYDVEVKQVAYEFQKGGNQMLCISA
tara:strand:+ start:384 stop:665 length:282 start_codon:yes stop_codon:yes gene_type:complete